MTHPEPLLPYTQIGETLYLILDGELYPAVYGGAESQDPTESEDPPAQPDFTKMFTDFTKEVTKTVKASLKPIQDKLNVIDTWRTEIDARFRPSETETDPEPETETETDPTTQTRKRPTVQEGALKKQLKDLNDQVSRLTTANKEAEERTHTLTLKERNSSRDRQLSESLSSFGVVSIEGGIKFFRDDLNFDDDNEDWFYATKDGARYSIPEMVTKFTPDWLKKAPTQSGGSGGGKPQGAQAVKAEIAKVKELYDAAQKNPTGNAATVYWRARKQAIANGIPAQDLDVAI